MSQTPVHTVGITKRLDMASVRRAVGESVTQLGSQLVGRPKAPSARTDIHRLEVGSGLFVIRTDDQGVQK